MLIVALTGGIGSGKSVVADEFARLGVPIIDTDVIARQLVVAGMPAHAEIVTLFGEAILEADGELNRRKLRQLVFDAPEKRIQLEQILHPRIREEVRSQIDRLQADYCIVVIPLLSEKGRYSFIHRILLVDAPQEKQIQRTMQRDRQSREQVEAILASQSSREQRLALADDILDNSGEVAELKQQVRQLHQQYQSLAHAQNG